MKKILLPFLFLTLSLFAQEENYTIKNLAINNKYQDFGVSFYNDTTAVFASARKSVFMKRVWSGNHEPFLRLYQGTISADGEIVNPTKFGHQLDTKYHESNLTFSNDLKTVYFDRNNYFHKEYRTNEEGVNLIQIYKATINEEGKWVAVERLPFNSDEFSSGHPILNADNTKLYFISDRPDSYGETDIYVVDIKGDGSYGEPKNLGTSVNTSKKEMFPFVDDNNMLYFSSNGYTSGKGGLDIYATKLNKQGDYYKPQNLGFPINSNKDDFALVKQKGKNTGYFSSNREGGKGDDDIYALTETTAPFFECKETIKGIVLNSKNNNSIAQAEVKLYYNNKELAAVITDMQGRFTFNVDCELNYKLEASKENFHQTFKEVSTSKANFIEVDLELKPIKNDHFITVRDQVMLNIPPIYFDLAKATIKETSAKELQMVVDLMNKYPEIIVQIRAHSDSRGNDNFNLRLSDRRAKATVNWILDKGIAKNRIFGIGFGEEDIINECTNGVTCSEEKHLQNRRTEFVILNPFTVGK
jgi:peptidoglycan-associated lipoprotein